MYYSTAHGITCLPIDRQQINLERFSSYNIMREISCPSNLAQPEIAGDALHNAWDLLIDESRMRHIQRCTEEASTVL